MTLSKALKTEMNEKLLLFSGASSSVGFQLAGRGPHSARAALRAGWAAEGEGWHLEMGLKGRQIRKPVVSTHSDTCGGVVVTVLIIIPAELSALGLALFIISSRLQHSPVSSHCTDGEAERSFTLLRTYTAREWGKWNPNAQ